MTCEARFLEDSSMFIFKGRSKAYVPLCSKKEPTFYDRAISQGATILEDIELMFYHSLFVKEMAHILFTTRLHTSS